MNNQATDTSTVLANAQNALTNISRLEGRLAALQSERARKVESLLAIVPAEFRPVENMTDSEFAQFLETSQKDEMQEWITWLGECLASYQADLHEIETELDAATKTVQELMDGLR